MAVVASLRNWPIPVGVVGGFGLTTDNANVPGSPATDLVGSILKLIGTVAGDPAAPGAVTVTVPVCVATARLPGVSVTTVESSGGAPPAAFESVIHAVSLVAVQVSAPGPVLLMRSENACGS